MSASAVSGFAASAAAAAERAVSDALQAAGDPAMALLPSAAGGLAASVVRGIVEDAIWAARDALHADVRALHVDMLRQMHTMQTELGALATATADRVARVAEDVRQLREESQSPLRGFIDGGAGSMVVPGTPAGQSRGLRVEELGPSQHTSRSFFGMGQ
jgi:hypothetical protein